MNSISLLKNKVNIEKMLKISGNKVKRAGKYSFCKCPIHKGECLSMIIDNEKNLFHCFECGANGDVIELAGLLANIDTLPTISWLFKKTHIPIPEPTKNGREVQNRVYQMNLDAAKFFWSRLMSEEGKDCMRYLKGRGVTADTIKKYKIGYAPRSWSSLKDHMLSLGYTEQELINGSLLTRSKKNGLTFDFYIDRAIFPFVDIHGHIVGFGGRILSGDDKRKYLNSRQNIGYQKSSFLFSEYFAVRNSENSPFILCEGNLDVISLNQAGFDTAVASCGTALTSEQAALINKYTDTVYICYDSDLPGRKAALKAIDILEKKGLKVYVITVVDAKDPDEYLKKFGADSFRNLMENALPALEYKIVSCFEDKPPKTSSEKVEFFVRLYKEIIPYYDSKDVMNILLKYDI